MDVREKLIKICFREFCDIAGDSPCGCDGCPYGEYDPDNGGCFDEYKKDKIEKLENDMDKYQKEDNGVTVQEWISVTEHLPQENEPVGTVCELVQVLLVNGDVSTGWYNRRTKLWWHFSYGASDFIDYDYEHTPVIAWQPLAQPPKGE